MYKTTVALVAGGYSIPAGTLVMSNLDEIMRDPEAFPDPHRFDPERFLDEQGRFRPHSKVKRNS